jgi:hypothetical protein
MCVSIMRNRGVIEEASYNLLLRGPGVFDNSEQPEYKDYKAVHDFISEPQWDLAYCMRTKVKRHFPGLLLAILDHQAAIRAWV